MNHHRSTRRQFIRETTLDSGDDRRLWLFAAPGKPNGGNSTATPYPGAKRNFVFNAATDLVGKWFE